MAIDIIEIAEQIENSKKKNKKGKNAKAKETSWKPVKLTEYEVPEFKIPDSRKKTDTRKYFAKTLAFIELNKNRRYKDACTIMPIPTTNKRMLSICGSPMNVTRLKCFMEYIGLISPECTDYQFGARFKQYNYSMTYRYYPENEILVKEYCEKENIDKFVIYNGRNHTVVNTFKDMDYFDSKEVRISSKLCLYKPVNYSKRRFEDYLSDKLYENYPWLYEYQQLANEINDKYYSEYPELSIAFEINPTWNKGNKSVSKIGIRATNHYVSATDKEDVNEDYNGYFKKDILEEYGLTLSKDVKSSVPRITLSLNEGQWIEEDNDIYKEIYNEYIGMKEIENNKNEGIRSNYHTVVNRFEEVRPAIKKLHMSGYFDRATEIGNHICLKMGLYQSSPDEWTEEQSEVYSEMALYQEAILKAEGGRLYDSEIFLHESCIYMDVLKELLDNGFFVWECYDAWYARKEGVSQEEFEEYVTELVKEKANAYIQKYRKYILAQNSDAKIIR